MKSGFLSNLVLITQLGISLVTPILVCLFISKWVVERYDFSSNWIILGILIGLVAGFLNVYKLIKKSFDRNNRESG